MIDGAIAKTVRIAVVLFSFNIGARLAKEVSRFMEPARMIGPLVDGGMPIDVLAVVDGRLPDFGDRTVDLANCLDFVVCASPVARTMFDHPARSAQVRQGVQISWMVRWWGRRARASSQNNKPHDEDHTVREFHQNHPNKKVR